MRSELRKWHNSIIGQRVVKELKKNNFAAVYCEDREMALQYILENIPSGAEIGVGGSSTLREIGLIDILREKGYVMNDHNKAGLSPEEKKRSVIKSSALMSFYPVPMQLQ